MNILAILTELEIMGAVQICAGKKYGLAKADTKQQFYRQ